MRHSRDFLFPSLFVLFIACGAARAGDIYVDDSHTSGTRDGQAWSTCFQFLQDAFGAASSDDIIHVAQGTYFPDDGAGHTNNSRTETFSLVSGVAVLGGYIGYNDPSPNTRDPSQYPTILSGDIGTVSLNTDNSYHVVTANSSSPIPPLTVLDGFTITAGFADDAATNGTQGAGILIKGTNSSPTIANCFLTANSTTSAGGGIGCTNAGHPTFVNCRIEGNQATTTGGGLDDDRRW